MSVSISQAEEALVGCVQSLLEHPSSACSDLVRLVATLRSNNGSFARSLVSLFESTQGEHQDSIASYDNESLCPLCMENSVSVRNICGHGLCTECWTEFAEAAIRNSSTPETAKGGDDAGASLVLDLKCPGDVNGKCRCVVELSVLKKALPHGFENFVRSVIRSLSKFLLYGGAAVAQCVCGAVNCSSLIQSEVECLCGNVQCIGDMKRGLPKVSFIPHPHLSSDELQLWQQINTAGSDQRSMIMRYKNCPKCGTMTTKCGCVGKVQCTGKDKCPNEACDHMKCGKCGVDWCWICRRIGSTEPRCSRPVTEQNDTKELILRVASAVAKIENELDAMSPKSLPEDLFEKFRSASVTLSELLSAISPDSKMGASTSSDLKRVVVSVSGVPVTSVKACMRAVKMLQGQCVLVETADKGASMLPELVFLQAPGYFSGCNFPKP
jgi:hypothetical protein